jgi:hypothetical protein
VPQPEGGPPVRMASSPGPLENPVRAAVVLPGNDGGGPDDRWTLEIVPIGGFAPTWRAPLLALVLSVSALLGGLLLVLLLNRQRQAWLLREIKARAAFGGGGTGA